MTILHLLLAAYAVATGLVVVSLLLRIERNTRRP